MSAREWQLKFEQEEHARLGLFFTLEELKKAQRDLRKHYDAERALTLKLREEADYWRREAHQWRDIAENRLPASKPCLGYTRIAAPPPPKKKALLDYDADA